MFIIIFNLIWFWLFSPIPILMNNLEKKNTLLFKISFIIINFN